MNPEAVSEPPTHEHVSCEVLLTGRCNLDCSYCVARHLPALAMPEVMVRQCLDLFFGLARGARSVEVTLTGGEPLLESGGVVEALNHATKLAQRDGVTVSFVIKTNGTAMCEAIRPVLLRPDVRTVVSIDGKPESHNRFRRGRSGTSTYDAVLHSLISLLHDGAVCTASMTVHPDLAGSVLENVKHLHQLGVDRIDVGPAYGTVAWTEAQVNAFAVSLLEVAAYVRDANETGQTLDVGPLYRESEHRDERLSQCWGCGAADNNLAFLPDGTIAGCSALAMLAHAFPALLLGSIYDGLNGEALNSLASIARAGLDRRPTCEACGTGDNCRGGCMAINAATSGDFLRPPAMYCRTMAALPRALSVAWPKIDNFPS